MTADVVLQACGVRKDYHRGRGLLGLRTGTVTAVQGIDLSVNRGETLGIVGESGSGKSTLARLLAGMERPTSGHIEVLGQPVHRLRGRALRRVRRDVQLVYQDPFTSLDPRMSVEAIVREPLDIHTSLVPRADRRRVVHELLEMVGLNPDDAGLYPHQFSGGQRQRIGLARALALRPQVLVLDEPVSALDVSVQAQIINLLENLQRELSLAYVFIAHDLAVVHHISHRVAVMYFGEIVEHGTHADIYAASRHPYTRALLDSTPEANRLTRHTKRRAPLRGEPPSPLDPPPGCPFRPRCRHAVDRCATDKPVLTVVPGRAVHEVACHAPLS